MLISGCINANKDDFERRSALFNGGRICWFMATVNQRMP